MVIRVKRKVCPQSEWTCTGEHYFASISWMAGCGAFLCACPERLVSETAVLRMVRKISRHMQWLWKETCLALMIFDGWCTSHVGTRSHPEHNPSCNTRTRLLVHQLRSFVHCDPFRHEQFLGQVRDCAQRSLYKISSQEQASIGFGSTWGSRPLISENSHRDHLTIRSLRLLFVFLTFDYQCWLWHTELKKHCGSDHHRNLCEKCRSNVSDP